MHTRANARHTTLGTVANTRKHSRGLFQNRTTNIPFQRQYRKLALAPFHPGTNASNVRKIHDLQNLVFRKLMPYQCLFIIIGIGKKQASLMDEICQNAQISMAVMDDEIFDTLSILRKTSESEKKRKHSTPNLHDGTYGTKTFGLQRWNGKLSGRILCQCSRNKQCGRNRMPTACHFQAPSCL